jgi:hypothetical protein
MPENTHEESSKSQVWVAGIQALAQIFTSLVETFGWPGASVVLTFWFTVWYATAEQKQRIIETYILGTGIARLWPMLIMAFLFAATGLAQYQWYVKKIKTLSNEVEREGKAKSELQEKQLAKQLEHAKTTTAKPKRR